MGAADVVDHAVGHQPLGAVLADGLEHPVAQAVVGLDPQQRLVDERVEQVGDVGGVEPGRRRDRAPRTRRWRRRGRPRAARRAARSSSREQVPAPLHDGAQRAVPGHRRAAAAGEQPEPVAEPGGDLRDRQHPQPRRGQLDGERQTVEPPDDVDHVADVALVDREGRRRRPGPGRRTARTDACRSAVGRIRRRVAAAAAAAAGTAPRRRCPAARGWWRAPAAPGSSGQQVVDQRGDVGDEVLAVVDHEQGGRPRRGCRAAGRCVATVARSPRRSSTSRAWTPRLPRKACGSGARVGDGASSTNQTPSAIRSTHSAATTPASRVLPAPPGPTMVASRPLLEQRVQPLLLVVATEEAGERRPAGWCAARPAGVTDRCFLQQFAGAGSAARLDGSVPSSSASRCRSWS